MKHRLTIAAIATTAALAGTRALLVPAASASPSAAKTHTVSVTSVQVSQARRRFRTALLTDDSCDVPGAYDGFAVRVRRR